MKKLLLTLFLIIIPTFIYADIAGPVLTKDQACTEKDGASRNRLQIFLNGKKSDTLYFYKKSTTLYYIVPMFPYTEKTQGVTTTYTTALFLYQYDCESKKTKLLSTRNLKELITQNTIFTPATPINRSQIKEFNYGEVLQVTASEVFLEIGITQSGIRGSYSLNLKTKKFENQIYIDENWSLKNYKDYNRIYSNEGDWRGVIVFYQGKKVYHFAHCKGWGTKRQSEVDDFCGGIINILGSRNDGLSISLSYDYPGAPLEAGTYMIEPNGSIINVLDPKIKSHK